MNLGSLELESLRIERASLFETPRGENWRRAETRKGSLRRNDVHKVGVLRSRGNQAGRVQ